MQTFLQLFKMYLFVVCLLYKFVYSVYTCAHTFVYVCRDQGRYWLPFLDHFILFPPDQVSVEPGEPCFLVRLEVTKCQGMSCLCILSTGIIGVHHCTWLLHRCWGSNPGPYACVANTWPTEPCPELPAWTFFREIFSTQTKVIALQIPKPWWSDWALPEFQVTTGKTWTLSMECLHGNCKQRVWSVLGLKEVQHTS